MPANDIFERSRALLGEDGFARLANARVAVFGVGGVGGWCAECLARTGVGALTIVDGDVVAPSNANRQTMASSSSIGRAKVDALAERLLDINPALRIEARRERYCLDTAGRFNLEEYDAAIDAIDSVDCKALLIRNATAAGKTAFFSSMGAARRFDPSKVRCGQFRKVCGDSLAKALRARFRKEDGALPAGGKFVCVWSEEPAADIPSLGSLAQVTAVFGFNLAALAVDAIARRP